MVTVRAVIALAVASYWFIFQMDVHNVFLQGDLLEEVYMTVPDAFSNQGECTKVGHELLIILVYIDDLLVTGSNLSLIKQVRKDLEERFKMKNLGELKYFLGIEFSRSQKGIIMCQRKYALELVSESGLAGGKPATTPLEFNHKLTSVKFDQLIHGKNATDDAELADKGKFQRLVGRLLYLTTTRSHIAFIVQVLGQHMHAPKVSHMEAALRVIRYIKTVLRLGLFMPAGRCQQLVAFCDSDWGSCVETRRSVTGYVVKFGEALIS
ncbi:uncharacterized mitochondrial protein AtMg00810-like [Nicotiana tomentosiformis]|uniref:uncharacterized mitochondrial protein AtMg00810-like n=1 Tax=Nicotiana tomentosiformis TaxID=4098 RepID=UPI00388C5404